MKIFIIFISAMLVNNFVLSKFLGICSFLGVSKKLKTSIGMGSAVVFVMTLASVMSYMVYHWILEPLEITYLYTIAFVLVIASLVQLVEMIIKKYSPSLYKALGIFLPLITTNCAVLGVSVINMKSNYTLLESVVNGLGASFGYTLAIVLFAGIREKMEKSDIPRPLKGLPIGLISAGLMSIAFLGFQGLVK
ncbi:electron transport complex subunit RsxA [Haloimpatiens sp. FM7330]|uniref:electron transport complex subunit RsxA n=1 Tax=Haloimpatiens sp. FM7330 TaxID=3298610 RepID=UPI0036362AB7